MGVGGEGARPHEQLRAVARCPRGAGGRSETRATCLGSHSPRAAAASAGTLPGRFSQNPAFSAQHVRSFVIWPLHPLRSSRGRLSPRTAPRRTSGRRCAPRAPEGSRLGPGPGPRPIHSVCSFHPPRKQAPPPPAPQHGQDGDGGRMSCTEPPTAASVSPLVKWG